MRALLSFLFAVSNCKAVEQDCTALKKECEAIRLELVKTQQVKNRLETLCRELQKNNRDVHEESLAASKRDEELRNDVRLLSQHPFP